MKKLFETWLLPVLLLILCSWILFEVLNTVLSIFEIKSLTWQQSNAIIILYGIAYYTIKTLRK